MDGRLPAHLEVAGLLRAVEAAGGFATILRRGERDAGTIAILTLERGMDARLWERMPQLDGSRIFTCTRGEDGESSVEFGEYLARRMDRDPDCWFVELDIANAQQFVASLGT